ncbi:MAG: hypothetical protein WCS65_02045 [Verrucomicrobiae bacterium]
MKITWLLGTLLLAGTPFSSFSGEVVEKNGKLFGRDVFTLDNGLVRLSVTPEIGGRVLEFVNLKTGHGSAKVRADNIAKKPTDNWAGAEYGGFTDAPTLGLGWPGDFWMLTYEMKFEDGKDGAKAIVASAQTQDIGIERRMTIAPGSTALRVEVKETNLSKRPQMMRIRLHCEMAQGTRGDDNDDIYFQSADGLNIQDYAVGAEYARMAILKVTGGWVSLSDTVENESVVKVLRAEGEQEVFYWAGANESTEIVGDDGAFVGLDWLGKEQLVEAGHAISSVEDIFVVGGIGKPDFVETGNRISGEVAPDRKIYGKAGIVTVKASLASATVLPASTVRISIASTQKELASLDATIPSAAPGIAATTDLKWHYADLPDGNYTIKSVISDSQGKTLGTSEKVFAVNSALVDRLASALSKDKKTLEDLKAKIKSQGSGGLLDISTEIHVLEFHKGAIEKLMDSGSYDNMTAESDAFGSEAAHLNSVLSQENNVNKPQQYAP